MLVIHYFSEAIKMTISVISVKKNLSKRICHDMYVIHLKPILLHQHTPSHPPFEKKYFAMIYLGTFLFIYRTQYITINKHRCDGNRKEEKLHDWTLNTGFLGNYRDVPDFSSLYTHTHTHTHWPLYYEHLASTGLDPLFSSELP